MIEEGQPVITTDTHRRATVLEICSPFNMAYLQYDSGGTEGWYPLSLLAPITEAPNRDT